jgi:hypothetical protein
MNVCVLLCRPAKCDWCVELGRESVVDDSLIDTLVEQNIITAEDGKRFVNRQVLCAIPAKHIIHCSGCGTAAVRPTNNSQRDSRVICSECGIEYCYSCSVQWHVNMSCKQYQATRKGQDKDTKKYLKSTSKPCVCINGIELLQLCFGIT